MLTLVRRPYQRIMIGDDIIVEVLSVEQDGAVRLGVKAPRHISVDREEVRSQKIRKENDQ